MTQTRDRPRGARQVPLLSLLVGLLVVLALAPRAPGAFALFSASDRNPGAKFAATALYAPTALTATASGHNVALSWTAGQNGSAYAVAGVSNGASSNCSAATLASLGTAAGTTYTDTGRFSPQGSYWCYRATTTYGVWSSVTANPTVATRIGFFADTVIRTNGGTSGSLGIGDQIAITFNQAADTSTGAGPASSDTVCTTLTTIYIGSTSTVCGVGETLSVGTLTGGTLGLLGRWNASYTWSNSNKTLTVALTAGGALATVGSGAMTFNPSTVTTKLMSATGNQHVCDNNSGGGTCLPTASGSF